MVVMIEALRDGEPRLSGAVIACCQILIPPAFQWAQSINIMTGRKLSLLMLGSVIVLIAAYFFLCKNEAMDFGGDFPLGRYKRTAGGIVDTLHFQGSGRYSQDLEIKGEHFTCNGSYKKVAGTITLERMYLIPSEVRDSLQPMPRLLHLVPLEDRGGSIQYLSEAKTITFEYVR